MGGHIRGLGTSESWFSLVHRAIVLFWPGLRGIPVLVGFVLDLHSGFLF
jgi:hypothetical protein